MALRHIVFSTTCAVALTAGVVMQSAGAANDGPHVAPITAFAQSELQALLSDAVVLDAIRAQNAETAGMAEADIIVLDEAWRAETAAPARPMIDEVLANPLSVHLRDWQQGQAGLVTEVFVMDGVGLNVGQSDMTSDYWQGDEAKWQNTYQAGPDALFIDEIEMDESTQTFQSQVSASIVDPDTGEVIGAITVGINVDAL